MSDRLPYYDKDCPKCRGFGGPGDIWGECPVCEDEGYVCVVCDKFPCEDEEMHPYEAGFRAGQEAMKSSAEHECDAAVEDAAAGYGVAESVGASIALRRISSLPIVSKGQATIPKWSFGNDPNTGLHLVPPREPGEVRTFHAEYLHPEGGWGSAEFIEDDTGCRWRDLETDEEYVVEQHPMVLLAYYYRLPWVDPVKT